MASLNRGQTFSVTETITNSKLHALVDSGSVTNIVNADIDSNAGIVDTKLADITTLGKISAIALRNLSSLPTGAGVFPYYNIPSATLVSIPNSSLLPISLASWVSGQSFKDLASVPTTVGTFPYQSIVPSLASGSLGVFAGGVALVGKTPAEIGVNPDYVAGSYSISNPSKVVHGGTETSYTKIAEIYIPRNGTFTTKFMLARNVGVDTVRGRIYRNGIAVGTERISSSTTLTEYSEDISGWVRGDLCQLYAKADSGAESYDCGNLRLYENTPTREILAPSFETAKIYSGSGAPDNGLGSQGDLYLRTDGSTTTTLYVKTGASTWTAK